MCVGGDDDDEGRKGCLVMGCFDASLKKYNLPPPPIYTYTHTPFTCCCSSSSSSSCCCCSSHILKLKALSLSHTYTYTPQPPKSPHSPSCLANKELTHLLLLPLVLLLVVGQLKAEGHALVGAHQHAELVAAEEGLGDVGAEEDALAPRVGLQAFLLV